MKKLIFVALLVAANIVQATPVVDCNNEPLEAGDNVCFKGHFNKTQNCGKIAALGKTIAIIKKEDNTEVTASLSDVRLVSRTYYLTAIDDVSRDRNYGERYFYARFYLSKTSSKYDPNENLQVYFYVSAQNKPVFVEFMREALLIGKMQQLELPATTVSIKGRNPHPIWTNTNIISEITIGEKTFQSDRLVR